MIGKSDEDRATQMARSFTPTDFGGTIKARAESILAFVTAVRAEASAAKDAEIAALREAAKIGKLWIEGEIEAREFEASEEEIKGDLTISCANDALKTIDAALEMSGGV